MNDNNTNMTLQVPPPPPYEECVVDVPPPPYTLPKERPWTQAETISYFVGLAIIVIIAIVPGILISLHFTRS